MNRREFLFRVGGSLVAVPMVLEAISCGSDSSTAPPPDPNSWAVGSDADATGHSHAITLQCSQLTSAGDVVYTTSTTSAHSHTVTLTPTQLATIGAGGTVNPATDPDSTGHGHAWTIQKPAGKC